MIVSLRTGSCASLIVPRVMRETSSRSSTSRVRCIDLAVDDVARPLQLRIVDREARHDLDRVADRRERIAQLVREDREELVLVAVRFEQRRLGARTLGDLGLQRSFDAASSVFASADAVERFELARLFRLQRRVGLLELLVRLGEAAVELLQLRRWQCSSTSTDDLAAQDLRHDRDRHVVDRAELVALQAVELGDVHAGDEDDRRALEARMIVDHRRGLEAVHARHADVEQHHRELVLHQARERLHARARADEVLAELAQDRFVGQQPRRLVVDQQDVDLVRAWRGSRALSSALSCETVMQCVQRCSHIRTSDSSCSVLTGFAT